MGNFDWYGCFGGVDAWVCFVMRRRTRFWREVLTCLVGRGERSGEATFAVESVDGWGCGGMDSTGIIWKRAVM